MLGECSLQNNEIIQITCWGTAACTAGVLSAGSAAAAAADSEGCHGWAAAACEAGPPSPPLSLPCAEDFRKLEARIGRVPPLPLSRSSLSGSREPGMLRKAVAAAARPARMHITMLPLPPTAGQNLPRAQTVKVTSRAQVVAQAHRVRVPALAQAALPTLHAATVLPFCM